MEVIVEAIGNRLRGWLDAMLLFDVSDCVARHRVGDGRWPAIAPKVWRACAIAAVPHIGDRMR